MHYICQLKLFKMPFDTGLHTELEGNEVNFIIVLGLLEIIVRDYINFIEAKQD